MRALPLLLALLFALSPIATAAVPGPTAPTTVVPAGGPFAAPDDPTIDLSGAPVARTFEETTAYLTADNAAIETSRIDTVTIDVSATTSVGGTDIENAYRSALFVERFERASDRRAVVEAEIDRVAERTAALRGEQAAVIAAYNDGDLSTRAFLGELAAIGAEASALREHMTVVIDRSRQLSLPRAVTLRASGVANDLDALSGPVRDRLLAALSGEADAPRRFSVETAADGVIVATLDDGMYVREAYLGGERAASDDTGFGDVGDAFDAVKTDFYPWASANGVVTTIGDGADIYRFSYQHSQGTLSTFLNGNAGVVFAEFQTKQLDAAPTKLIPPNSTQRLRLQVGLTHPGGQLAVRASNPNTGTPVDAVVYVDGERVGRTGDDGRLYTLTPRGRVNTTIAADGETVTIVSVDRAT